MLDHIRLSSWYVPKVDFGNPRRYLVGGFNPVEKYYCSQNGNLPQVGVKIKNIGNHLDMFEVSWISWMAVFQMSYSTFCKVSYSWLSILDFRAFQKRIPPMLPTNLSIVYYLGGWHAFFSNLEIPLEKKTKPFWMGLGTKLHPQALPGRWMELPEIGMAQLLHSFFCIWCLHEFCIWFFFCHPVLGRTTRETPINMCKQRCLMTLVLGPSHVIQTAVPPLFVGSHQDFNMALFTKLTANISTSKIGIASEIIIFQEILWLQIWFLQPSNRETSRKIYRWFWTDLLGTILRAIHFVCFVFFRFIHKKTRATSTYPLKQHHLSQATWKWKAVEKS